MRLDDAIMVDITYCSTLHSTGTAFNRMGNFKRVTQLSAVLSGELGIIKQNHLQFLIH